MLCDVVAEAVGGPLPGDLLDRLHDVGVVAEHEADVGRGQQRPGGGDLRVGRVLLVLAAAVQARDDDLGAGSARPGGRGEHAVGVRRRGEVDRPLPPVRQRHAVQAEGARDVADDDAADLHERRPEGLTSVR